jgi:hypothetical protein
MPGYNSPRRGTSQISFKFFDYTDVPNFMIVVYVPFSVSCVLFVCKCVLMSPGVNPIAVKYISYQDDRHHQYRYRLGHLPSNTRCILFCKDLIAGFSSTQTGCQVSGRDDGVISKGICEMGQLP